MPTTAPAPTAFPTALPTQAQLQLPLLEAVRAAGGTLRAADACDALAERYRLSETARRAATVCVKREAASGEQVVGVWRRHVRFVRQKLVAAGLLASGGHGLWTLTDAGHAGLAGQRPAVTVLVLVDPSGRPVAASIESLVALPAVDAKGHLLLGEEHRVETVHTIRQSDARDLAWLDDQSIGAGVTSLPYFDLLRDEYEAHPAQLSNAPSYEAFLDDVAGILGHYFRVLVPGGFLTLNVGDVLRDRKTHGRHHLLPLSSDVRVLARRAGFDCRNDVRWQKIGNVKREQGGAGGFLGKPYLPNRAIELAHEPILVLRRPGTRHVDATRTAQSRLCRADDRAFFRDVWTDIPGASTRNGHPAPWPEEVPYRLIRMFSYVGDTILDACDGHGNTTRAAMRAGRHSVGCDLAPGYVAENITRSQARAEQQVRALAA